MAKPLRNLLAKPSGSKGIGLFRYRNYSLARTLGTSAIERRARVASGKAVYDRWTNPSRRKQWLYQKLGIYGPKAMTVARQAYKGYKKGGVAGAVLNTVEKPLAAIRLAHPKVFGRLLWHRFKASTGLNLILKDKQQPKRKLNSLGF